MSRATLAAASTALALTLVPRDSAAQVYGYTDDKGVLILSNVPTHDGMRLIVDGTEEEGKSWHYSGQYDAQILEASRLYGVDPALVRAVIAVESAFNRNARSHKGAEGLMQLMPETGRRYGVVNPYDPRQNIRGGTRHLRDLIDEFSDIHLALAAYNAGATPVRRYGTIPPYSETRNYVRKVMAIYRAGSRIEIVKGDRVYRIAAPGGQTRVSAYEPRTVASSAGGASTLAELARRVAAARGERDRGPAPQPPAVSSASAEPAAVQTAANHVANLAEVQAVYYRYVDAEGTIYITPRRPASYPYDVLPR